MCAILTNGGAGRMEALAASLDPVVVFRGPAFPDAMEGRDRVGGILAVAFGKEAILAALGIESPKQA